VCQSLQVEQERTHTIIIAGLEFANGVKATCFVKSRAPHWRMHTFGAETMKRPPLRDLSTPHHEIDIYCSIQGCDGVISGPAVRLFRSLNDSRRPGIAFNQRSVLEFFKSRHAQPKDDYRELIEFSMTFLDKLHIARFKSRHQEQ